MRTIDASAAESSGLASPRESASGAAAVQKALAILEIVADREGATAREIATALGIPLSTA
jgi:IclR family acetate operon transcriptional repressor